MSRVIICDRDPKFTSVFWQSLFKQLQTKLNISSAYHPQTDGQTERTHRTIEQILRSFTLKHQNAWLDVLPLAEFSYNNSCHTSTSFSPFETVYGFSPLTPPALVKSSSSEDWIAKINDIHALVTENLKNAKVLQSHYADKKRIEKIFNVGDVVCWTLQTCQLLTNHVQNYANVILVPSQL